MTDLTTSTPDGAATTPVESTPAAEIAATTPVRAPDGKFIAATQTDQSATTEPDVGAAEADGKPEPEKPRSRAAERIAQLTAEKHAAIREAAALRQRYEAQQKVPAPRIDPNDFDAVQREATRGVIREETAQQTAIQYNEAVTRARQAMAATFHAKVESVRDRIPDIDQTMQRFGQLPLSDDVCELIAESEVAPEIARHLVLNPRDAAELQHLSPAQQGRALARIEAKLSLPSRRTSNTPPPPPSVTGAGSPTTRAPSEMSIADLQSSLKKSGIIR